MKKTVNIPINWVWIGVLTIILSIVTLLVLFVPEIRGYDMSILQAIQALLVNFPTSFAQQACTIGSSHYLLWPQLCAVSVLFSHKKYANGILLVIFTQIAWRLTDYIKDIIARPRPCADACHGFSFPSGHAATTICFYGILVYLVLHYVKNQFWRLLLTTVFSVFIFIVAISRMKLNMHFLTDIIAGLCFGGILLNLFIIISKHLEKNNVQ